MAFSIHFNEIDTTEMHWQPTVSESISIFIQDKTDQEMNF